MFGKNEIMRLQEKVDQLSEKIELISDKQNTQFTEIMMQLKEYVKPVAEDFDVGTDDKLYEEAKNMVLSSGKASTSWLQRKLGIGYSRAACLIDALEEEGIVGPANGSSSREVFKDSEEK